MRIRLLYSKTNPLTFTSTLDVQTIWERSFRRSGLSLQYSQGFHPQPRIQIANPLPLGYIGMNEMVDVWLTDDLPIAQINKKINANTPDGIRINKITLVDEKEPSLSGLVYHSEYLVSFYDTSIDRESLSEKIHQLLKKETIIRERNRKKYDLRPLVISIQLVDNDLQQTVISLRLCSAASKTGRPEEVLFELGFSLADFSIERTGLVLKTDDV